MGKLFGRLSSESCGNLFQTGCIMRAMVIFTASVALVCGSVAWSQPTPKDEKKDGAKDAKDTATPAAELTRTKALKTKVSAIFTDARLGDVLKEFAAQVDMKSDLQLLWVYGPDFPFAKKVNYTCKDKPLEAALDELFKKNGGLGYIVVSKDGDKHDGWVLLTTTGERGVEKPEVKLTEAEETDAADKLALAKKLIDGNKTDQAKTVLTFIMKKYPTAKVAAEAKELLAKLEK
jgi:hypothetical protein